jgi:hypothetical protein
MQMQPLSYNTTIVERNKSHFTRILENKSIAEYFQIRPTIGSLEFVITDFVCGTYHFTVKYKTKYVPKIDFKTLPVELNHIIHSFLDDFIILNFEIDLRHNFPFSKPIWNLIDVHHSYDTRIHIPLFDYYNHIVDLHNTKYDTSLSSSFGMKSDILIFIRRINHFEVFYDY